MKESKQKSKEEKKLQKQMTRQEKVFLNGERKNAKFDKKTKRRQEKSAKATQKAIEKEESWQDRHIRKAEKKYNAEQKRKKFAEREEAFKEEAKTHKQPDKSLPNFTKGEEIFNAVTHIVGGGFGVIFLIVGVIFAHLYSNLMGILSMYVYGICMIVAYTMSAIYHFLRKNRAKRVFRVFDHCSIFLLISGSYTPFCLVTLANTPAWGFSLFAIVWTLSILGVVLNAIDMHKWLALSQVLYLALGWCIILAIVPLWQNLPVTGFWWLLGGGIAYTVGAILFGIGRKVRYMHSIFHLFVLLGTICQFVSILFYVILPL